jgi:hypothetical protein
VKPDLLIVADPRDALANAFAAFAREAGREVLPVDFRDAARLYTIEVGEEGALVDPDVPVFLRPCSTPAPNSDPDSVFHHGECVATVWAAAGLCKARVINRPGPHGFAGRCSSAAVITELRGGFHAGRPEVIALKLPPPGRDGEEWWTQSLTTYATARWPDASHGAGPFRARPARACDGYEIVPVVGSQAWRSTLAPLDPLELEARSVRAARALDLAFAAVTWAVAPDFRAAAIARVDPWPQFAQVQYAWPAVAGALLEFLTR